MALTKLSYAEVNPSPTPIVYNYRSANRLGHQVVVAMSKAQ
jgi:hypothetical protein